MRRLISSNTVISLRTFEQYTDWDCERGVGAPGAPPSESATVVFDESSESKNQKLVHVQSGMLQKQTISGNRN